MKLKDKTALVTGASSGLGEHFARVLAAMGAHVTAAARRVDRLERLCADISADGLTAYAVAMDVTDRVSVDRVFADQSFDIVINNAGVTFDGPAIKTDESNWNWVLDTDLNGVFRVAQNAGQALVRDGKAGSIINIASILGLRVAGNVSAYATAKAGVVQMTKSLALEWARYGIRVNAICPGYIETDLNRDFFASEAGNALIQRIPQRRLGHLSELDGPLLLLASDDSSFMTGTEIVVDGGHLVSSL
ncbi:SDR family oxidoreductase [Amylibacter sp.]|nr:SDR family oxidoreductase [Planktomarina sp.]MDA8883574.1 SDR family oxidoreductase [Planktomarina temperata]MDA9099970.1 SDR family oxidoreductase [Planktomarina sp.]MDA9237817.1 SDR family oxidoreductase [Planktomarina sp.]MDB9857647.1 SDR family oxidoreductase [Amylibacter sp.]